MDRVPIMLRRAVGGLDKTRQLELYRRISPYLEPNVTGRKLPRRPSEHEIVELWRLAASFLKAWIPNSR